jgi:hypothetical protein
MIAFFGGCLIGLIWLALDGSVTRSAGNPSGCLKVAYMVAGALFLVFLIIIAVGLFTYPLRNP